MKFDGAKLKSQREKMDFSLQELANLIGASKSYIHELENNDGIEPGGLKVFKLSKALGVPMEWFYGEDCSEDIKQAIVNLAHAVSSFIGEVKYYEICGLCYPNFKKDPSPHPINEQTGE